MDYNKILNELNNNILFDGVDFFLTTTGYVDVIGLFFDGNELILYHSDNDTCETNGDVIFLIKRRMYSVFKTLEDIQDVLSESVTTSSFLFTKCPRCGESDCYTAIAGINGIDIVRCDICKESYRR